MNPANPTASNKLDLSETFGSVLRCFVANPAIGGNLAFYRNLFTVKLVSKWYLTDTECNLDI